MSYEVRIAGRLRFPNGTLRSWREAPLDPAALGDTPAPFRISESENEPLEVESRLRWYDSTKVTIRGDRVKVSDRLEKSMFWDVAPHLVAAFRLAAAYGARGELMLVGEDGAEDLGYRVEVSPKGSRMTNLNHAAQDTSALRAIVKKADADKQKVYVPFDTEAAVAGLTPYVELCLHAAEPNAASLLTLAKPAARILELTKKLEAKRPKLVSGLVYLCAQNVGSMKTPTARAIGAELLGAALRGDEVPMDARMWADSFYDAGKRFEARAAVLADPDYVLAHSDPMSPVKKLVTVGKKAKLAKMKARLERLAKGVATAKQPPGGLDHDQEKLAEKIRALAAKS
jgi:hypothetical protein